MELVGVKTAPGEKQDPLGGISAAKSDNGDDLKQLLLQCIRDAADIVKEAGTQFSNEEIRKLAATRSFQRTRLA